MFSLVALILVAVAALAVASSAAYQRRVEERVDAWQGAARVLGLSYTPSPDPYRKSECSIHGVLHGVPVRLDTKQLQASSAETSYQVHHFSAGGDGQIPARLLVREESVLRSLGLRGRDERVGDERFDDAVELPGMDAYVCAALSADARTQLTALIELGGSVEQGQIHYELPASDEQDRPWLIRQLRALAELGQLLSVSAESLHERLAQNALRDPSPGVRQLNLRWLADPHTRTPAAVLEATARALLVDADAAVRLLAAQQLGPAGAPVLRALLSDAQQKAALRVGALRALDSCAEFDPGGAPDNAGALGIPLLECLLGAGPPELTCAALSIVATRQLSSLFEALVACASNPQEQVRSAAASALSQVVLARAEQALLREQALVRLLADPSAEVQRAGAEALGAVGSVRVVEPLLRLADSLGVASPRQAARGAIGRIQSRLGNVEAGRVSLADASELRGAVDVVRSEAAEGGELSLPDADPNPRRART